MGRNVPCLAASTRTSGPPPAVGHALGQHGVQQGAYAEDVCAGIDGVPACLLGCHARWRAQDDGLAASIERGAAADALRVAPVHQIYGVVGTEHHVARFHVAVHKAEVVGAGQRIADSDEDVDELEEVFASWGPTVLVQAVLQRAAVDELHRHQWHASVVESHRVDRQDVGVVQRGRQPGLSNEALHHVGLLNQRGMEALDGHGTVEAGVDAVHHPPHAAFPQQGVAGVWGKRHERVQRVDWVRHPAHW